MSGGRGRAERGEDEKRRGGIRWPATALARQMGVLKSDWGILQTPPATNGIAKRKLVACGGGGKSGNQLRREI